jgi:DNA polymerase-3 subunit beta
VPASAMQDFLRVVGDSDEDVKISHNEQQAMFKIGDVELVTRLVDGKYPDYKKLIPAKFKTQATLKKADLVNVTKVSSLFARESAGSVTIELDKTAKQLSIRSVASQLGENTATAPAKITDSGTITLNSRYLLDALNVINGENVVFGFNGKLEPTLLSTPDDPDYRHIIMPLKS